VEIKNIAVEQARMQLLVLKKAQSADASAIGQSLKWSASYLPERFPNAMGAVTTFIAVEAWVDSMWPTEECERWYQVLKWAILGAVSLYLVLTGFETSSQTTWTGFLRSFWGNLLVLPLLLMSMVALPPIPCYIGSVDLITDVGAYSVVGVGVIWFLYDWTRGGQSLAEGVGEIVASAIEELGKEEGDEEEEEDGDDDDEEMQEELKLDIEGAVGHLVLESVSSGDPRGAVYRLVLYKDCLEMNEDR